MTEEDIEVPAFACRSVGIGRWLWVVWRSESSARAGEAALARGYEKSAARAEEKAAERAGARPKRLPAKWASGSTRHGSTAPLAETGVTGIPAKPKPRGGRPKRDGGTTRLAFLYAAAERVDQPGVVAVAKHRVVKETAAKIRVESEPFDEEEWRRRVESAEDVPKTRTLAVDRVTLWKERRFACRDAYRELTFYASEEDGIRDVEAALTAKHAWCAALGVRFPCSADTVKAAYRRLARSLHPDAGGDPAAFRAAEEAYREALAYLSKGEGS